MANISNSTNSKIITGSSEADSIVNIASRVTINANNGDDTIIANYGDEIIKYAKGDGNDIIFLKSTHLSSEHVVIDITSGSLDSIYGQDSSATLKIGSESIVLNSVDDNLVEIKQSDGSVKNIYFKDGKVFNYIEISISSGDDVSIFNGTIDDDYIDKIYNKEKVIITLDCGDGDDYVSYSNHAIIFGGTGDDYIVADYGTVDAGSGNDIIHSCGSSVKAGAGKDSIYVFCGDSSIVDGGDGDDYLQNDIDASDNSLNGGAGNDLIENYATHIKWAELILDENNNEQIIEGEDEFSSKEYYLPGGDYGTGLTVVGGKGNDTIRNTFIDKHAGTFVEKDVTIKSYFKSATEYIEEEHYSNGRPDVTITSTLIYDRIIQYSNGDGDDVIEDYHDTDKIQITDGSSYSTIESGNDIIVNVGSGSITLKNAKGITLNISGGTYDSTSGNTNLDTIKLTNADKSPYTAESSVGTIDGTVRTKAIKITGNANANVIIGGKKNDTLTGGAGNDTFVSGAGKDVVTDYAEGDVISLTGALTKATTKNSDVTLTIGKGSLNLKGVKGKKITLIDSKGDVTKQAFGEKSITVIDGDGDTINTAIDAAVITVDASARTEDVVLIGNSKANTIIGGGGNDELTGGKGKDLFIYTGGNDIITDYKASDDKIKLDGAAIKNMEYVGTQGTDLVITTDKGTLTIENAVSLKSSKGKIVKTPQKITLIQSDGTTTSQTYQFATVTGGANTMSGGTGADTLYGLSGNDLLIGGKGKDVFVYGAGKDTVSDYTAKQDKIKFTAVTTEYEVEDKDVIFKFVDSGNTLRVVNGKDKAITVIDSTGKENTATYNDPTELVLKKTDSGKFDKSGDSKVVTIDASKTTKGVEIIANSNDNTIIAGKGKDTLTGGAGTDTFVYTNGNGNDIITDYKASEGDIIQLGKKTTISKATVSGDDYVFTIGKGKLTVKGGASQNITFVDVDDNEIVYKKRASRNYAELFDDDNFATDELISILDTNVNITNIDYDNNVVSLTEKNELVSISYNQQHEK